MFNCSVKVGPLILGLFFDDSFNSFFPDFFEGYLTKEPFEAKITIKEDSSLTLIREEELFLITDFSPKIIDNKLIMETSFARSEFDLKTKKGVIFLPNSCRVVEFSIIVYLQMISSILLLDHDCLLLHASAFKKDNKGYLFIGDSGSGKSTIAKKALDSKFLLLGDDCVVFSVNDKSLFSTFFKVNYGFETSSLDYLSFIEKSEDSLFKKQVDFKYSLLKLIKSNHLLLLFDDYSKFFMGKIIKLSKLVLENIEPVILNSRLEDDMKVICDVLEKN